MGFALCQGVTTDHAGDSAAKAGLLDDQGTPSPSR
jgi:hypothetical protein